VPPLSPITGGGWRQAALLHAGPRQCGALQAITATPTATGPSLFAAPRAVHDDLVAAVSLAAYDHMGDYDGTASPQAYGTQPAPPLNLLRAPSRRVGTLKARPPLFEEAGPEGGLGVAWTSVFEFVKPEHLALNSRSGFLYSHLWRPGGESIAGPIQALPNPARSARRAAFATTPS